MWQWARLMSVHKVCSGALLFRQQLTKKQHHEKNEKKSVNQIATGI